MSKLLLLLLGAGAVAAAVASLPDVKRYREMRRM